MTTEPARPTTAAHATVVLVATTGTLGAAAIIVLALTGAPQWLILVPLWIPAAAVYVAITVVAAARLAGALLSDQADADES